MSKHTPGPWAMSAERTSGIATVAIVGDFRVGPDHGRPEMADYSGHGGDEDDARLIAAAPELLESLQKLRDAYHAGVLEWAGKRGDMFTDLADTAIAKATGEQS